MSAPDEKNEHVLPDNPQQLIGFMTNEEWDNLLAQVSMQISEMENLPYPEVKEKVFELLAGVDTIHREGLNRLVRLFKEGVFEAVTGVISLDNLLVIGEHFGIWPKELITVEVQLGDNAFGDLVLSEIETNRASGEVSIVGDNPLMPEMEKIVARVFEATCKAATQKIDTIPGLQSMTAEQLTPIADVCHNQFIEDCKIATKLN